MKEMVIDGRLYTAWMPEELGATPGAPRNVRNMNRIRQMVRLMGTHDQIGPLGVACRNAAEHVHRGGHSPATERARLRALVVHAGDCDMDEDCTCGQANPCAPEYQV